MFADCVCLSTKVCQAPVRFYPFARQTTAARELTNQKRALNVRCRSNPVSTKFAHETQGGIYCVYIRRQTLSIKMGDRIEQVSEIGGCNIFERLLLVFLW